jgi:predicted acyltransferase
MQELTPPFRPRLVSLDVFRGITIAAMILVNNPGSWDAVYSPLRHAAWNGCTPADLVFPFFLFIVGVSLVFSCEHRISKGSSKAALARHALWRSLALIVLGLLLNGLFYAPWDKVRIPGVLQRIGVVYGLTLFVVLTTTRRMRGTITIALLFGYWLLMTRLPLPGHRVGDLTPAGNLASLIDCRLFRAHMWAPDGDPEGVLSTFPAIASALLGTFAGDWLLHGHLAEAPRNQLAPGPNQSKVLTHLLVAGSAALLIGLCWGQVFPLNKNLWTSSFAVFTAGMATLFLALCYWLVDEKGWQRQLRPFSCLGMNPLAVYVASQIGSLGALSALPNAFHPRVSAWIGSAPLASLLWAMVYVAVFLLIAQVLYRRGIFLKL